MEEKARLYTAMKRGDYVRTDGRDERGLIDFDRKWAEQAGHEDDVTSSDSDNEGSDGDQEVVEYLDEFGRTRKGAKADAVREERRQRIRANAAEEEERPLGQTKRTLQHHLWRHGAASSIQSRRGRYTAHG